MNATCDDFMERIGDAGLMVCVLPAGHDGWHEDGEGCRWRHHDTSATQTETFFEPVELTTRGQWPWVLLTAVAAFLGSFLGRLL